MAVQDVLLSVLKLLFIIGLFVIDDVQTQLFQLEEDCKIPGSNNFSVCTSIHECNSISNFLQSVADSKTVLTEEIVLILRSYQCGFQDNSIKVCCPTEMHFPNPFLNRFLPNSDPPPPDVSKHKNLRILPYECGLSQTTDRISMGNETFLGDFPWMALLNYSTGNGFGFKCGGTIISKRYVLTAAHCLANLGSNLKLVGVRLGEHNVTSRRDCEVYSNGVVHCAPPVQDISIEEIIPHPEFNPGEFMNDIGLIRLATPVNMSVETAKPICLPLTAYARNQNFTNTKLTVTGWGITERGKASDTLLYVNIPMLPRTECQKAYERSSVNLSYQHLCGGGKNRQDSCGGDSGGPLQRIESINGDARFTQYGVVSFGGKSCGRIGVPGVYTRLDYFMKWILDTIKP